MGPLCARWTDMVKVRSFRNYGRTSRVPRRPFEKDRLDAELKLMGLFGLRTKREIWRVGATLAHVRKAARELLKLDEKDNRRIFEGSALLRRLQTQVFKLGLAKSIHHARVVIRQRHIRVGRQIVNVPSFMVRLDSQKHIDHSLSSPFGGGRPGRVKRRSI